MNLGGEEGEMVSHGRIDGRQKVVWEKKGEGQMGKPLPPLSCMCAACC